MTARQVHAVLAAGVHNPALIARWEQEPELLRALHVDPEAFDLRALRKFTGLTVKVRHNPLRQDFPWSFRLLRLAELEIEVFAAYAAFRAKSGRGFAAAMDERAHDFLAFMQGWLDLGNATQVLLWDLVRHEDALFRLKRSTLLPAPSDSAESDEPPPLPSPASLPAVRGEIILREMQSDPRAVGAALFQREPAWAQIPREVHYLCYWRPAGTHEMQILELDEFAYYALTFIDGKRRVAEVSRELGRMRTGRRFLRLLGQLATVGIVAFPSPPKGGRS